MKVKVSEDVISDDSIYLNFQNTGINKQKELLRSRAKIEDHISCKSVEHKLSHFMMVRQDLCQITFKSMP